MKISVSDYIADKLTCSDIRHVFTVVGGGAMYLNHSFGHRPDLKCIYTHHEQAAAMAAEAYARINNQIAAVCVTSGPGATNAITGVIGGWMDSIPMLIISGQARYATTVYASGLKLRSRGIQEFDIIGSVKNMTKYCCLVENPEDIRYALEKALFLCRSGRPGPCWLDIPLDVQCAMIDPETLKTFPACSIDIPVSTDTVKRIREKIQQAERPVLYVGNGVRLASAHEQFLTLVEKLNIPVVTGMSSIDAIASGHRLYVGRMGGTGDRAGNFAVQNSDLLLCLGGRLSFAQTGFNYQAWARAAYKIINDIDDQELEKDSIRADLKVCCDVKDLIEALNREITMPLPENRSWNRQCALWKNKYPVVLPKHRNDPKPNIYAFFDLLSKKLGADGRLVVSVGTSRIAGSQASYITEGMRFITNPSTAAMGYGIPAAIGVCLAAGKKKTCLVTGEGSLQMNIQELQTIIQHNLPITIFVMNNGGYHSIRMTQKSYFGYPLIGVGPESGDLSFPDLAKLAPAYGFSFLRCGEMTRMEKAVDWALHQNTPSICEMMLSTEQVTEPKASGKRLDDGSFVSAPLEDMAPFLPEEELKENMFI